MPNRFSPIENLEQRRLLSAAVAGVVAELDPAQLAITYNWNSVREQDGFQVVDVLQGDTVVQAVAGEYLVQTSANLAGDAIDLQANVALERNALDSSVFLASAPLGTPFAEVVNSVRAIDAEATVEPNFIYYTAALEDGTPNDPFFNQDLLWGLRNEGNFGSGGSVFDADIDAEEAWQIATGEDTVVVVIDSSVDYNHPDLADNIFTNTLEIAGNGIDDDNNGLIDDIRGFDFADFD
ncbi:MAG: hypothetical protein AAGK78_16245, partial [Planctomycetota bacterium]